MRKMLRLDRICLVFQPPQNLIEPVVRDCVERMTRGEKLDPISVYYDGHRYLLKDGFHRVEAARRLKRRSIPAEVTKGTLAQMEADWRQYLAKLKRTLARDAGKTARRRPRSGL